METFSALLAFCAGDSPVTGEFPEQRPVTRGFDVFFYLCLNKRLSKQSWDQTGDLRYHRAHYDVIAMILILMMVYVISNVGYWIVSQLYLYCLNVINQLYQRFNLASSITEMVIFYCVVIYLDKSKERILNKFKLRSKAAFVSGIAYVEVKLLPLNSVLHKEGHNFPWDFSLNLTWYNRYWHH